MEMPKINERVLQLVDYYTDRSVRKFAESIKIPQQTVNRLFNIDTRTGKYPVVTTEILVAITEMYVDVDANWLLVGRGDRFFNEISATTTDGSTIEDKLLSLLKEKDAEIKEQAKTIGRLEERVDVLSKKSIDTTDAPGAICAAAGE